MVALAAAGCNAPNPIRSLTDRTPDHLALYHGARPGGTIYVAAGGRIWRIRGGALDAVTPADKNYSYPAASADGKHTAAALVSRGHSEIALGGADFTGLRPLTTAGPTSDRWALDLKPTFSPDGSRLAFMSDRAAGFSDEQVWEGPYAPYHPVQVTCQPDQTGGDDAPSYLADGQLLLFTQWQPQAGAVHGQVSEKRVPFSCLTQRGLPKVLLQKDGEDFMDAAAGPPGRIAYVHRRSEVSNLEVSADDGSAPLALTTFGDVRQAAWSADGANLLFISSNAGSFDLWEVAVTGKSPPVRLTWGANLDATARPAWIS